MISDACSKTYTFFVLFRICAILPKLKYLSRGEADFVDFTCVEIFVQNDVDPFCILCNAAEKADTYWNSCRMVLDATGKKKSESGLVIQQRRIRPATRRGICGRLGRAAGFRGPCAKSLGAAAAASFPLSSSTRVKILRPSGVRNLRRHVLGCTIADFLDQILSKTVRCDLQPFSMCNFFRFC